MWAAYGARCVLPTRINGSLTLRQSAKLQMYLSCLFQILHRIEFVTSLRHWGLHATLAWRTNTSTVFRPAGHEERNDILRALDRIVQCGCDSKKAHYLDNCDTE